MTPDQDLFDGHLSPSDVIRQLLDASSWTQEELATITGRSRTTITQIASGKTRISPSVAIVLAAAFGNSPEDWLRLDSNYQLSRIGAETRDVERRARIYGMAPVRDMQRRGWIKDTRDVDELETELKNFYGVRSLDEPVPMLVATRRTPTAEKLSPAQIAWCVRARRLASALQVARFSESRLQQAEHELRELAAYPKEARHLTKVLGSYGIRFVVVEPLPGAKMDGAAFWLSDNGSPVIAVSVRYDRVDAFWFTVLHEFSHIRHADGTSVDTEIVGETAWVLAVTDESEARANHEATSALVPPVELESFIRRVAPLYSRQRVIQFAHRLKIHPGIVVGQLQHRGEVGYSALRDLLVKIRAAVTETALTDGWGKTITPGLL